MKIEEYIPFDEELEKEILILPHWEDDEFRAIREAFLDYLDAKGHNWGENDYIDKLTDLLGVEQVSHDEYYVAWELVSKECCKFIEL